VAAATRKGTQRPGCVHQEIKIHQDREAEWGEDPGRGRRGVTAAGKGEGSPSSYTSPEGGGGSSGGRVVEVANLCEPVSFDDEDGLCSGPVNIFS
jgi:hypothetical protein